MTLVNGHAAPVIPVNDRGLLYGDGLFETIAVGDGRPRELDRHLRRLFDGCERLAISPPDVAILRREIEEVCASEKRAVLKIIVTRGQGSRGYRPAGQGQPTRILSLDPWPDHPAHYRDQGITATCCKTRLARNPRLAGTKHLNRLEQVLARGEWRDEYQEGLMLDTEGQVIEGTMSNVFVIRDGELYTPELKFAGVAGVMRERILECAAKAGIIVHVHDLTLSEVEAAQAMFFCNSLIGIWPVRSLDGHSFGEHRLTRELMSLLGMA
jgi:4-amino-4-deoxychorismate lyase